MGHLGHKIKLIDRQFRSRMDKNLENLGITTAQMNVLCYMEHHAERNVTQKQLSEAFNVKHSTMAGILQRMVEKCPRCGKNLNEGACSCRPETKS